MAIPGIWFRLGFPLHYIIIRIIFRSHAALEGNYIGNRQPFIDFAQAMSSNLSLKEDSGFSVTPDFWIVKMLTSSQAKFIL